MVTEERRQQGEELSTGEPMMDCENGLEELYVAAKKTLFHYFVQHREVDLSMKQRRETCVHRIEHGERYIGDQFEDEDRDKRFECWSNPERHISEICLQACDGCTVVTMDNRHIQKSVVCCSLVEWQKVSDTEIGDPTPVLESD